MVGGFVNFLYQNIASGAIFLRQEFYQSMCNLAGSKFIMKKCALIFHHICSVWQGYAHQPEARIVTRRNKELATDTPSIHYYDHYRAKDYVLAHAPFIGANIYLFFQDNCTKVAVMRNLTGVVKLILFLVREVFLIWRITRFHFVLISFVGMMGIFTQMPIIQFSMYLGFAKSVEATDQWVSRLCLSFSLKVYLRDHVLCEYM